jgi:hypothetical protein
MPVAGFAVDCQILRHRRHDDAIARSDSAHGERREQQRRLLCRCRLGVLSHAAIPKMVIVRIMKLDRR